MCQTCFPPPPRWRTQTEVWTETFRPKRLSQTPVWEKCSDADTDGWACTLTILWLCAHVKVASNLWRMAGWGGGCVGTDVEAGVDFPCSHQHPTPDSIRAGFCCCRLHVVKKTAREGSEQRGSERKSKSPWRIGRGSAANTVNSRQGSAVLLNSLYDCQGGCENSTCW